MDLKLVEIDLSNTTREGGSGLVVGPIYLCLIGGKYFCGKFDKQWYGLNFKGWYNPAGLQYDPPHENYSRWQKVWRIDGAVALAKALEHSYAERRRKYAIANRLESNGKTIDETAPIEAFYYYPEVDAMPADEDEEE